MRKLKLTENNVMIPSVPTGPSPLSPSLRVVCGDTHFKGNVTSTFGAIYIQFHVQVDDASRGFALEYWSVDNSR